MSDDRDDENNIVPSGRSRRGGSRSDDELTPTGKAGRENPAVRKAVRTDADDSENTLNHTRNPITFLGQVGTELTRVIWPTRSQMVTYTIVVFLFLIFMVGLINLVDFGAGQVVEFVFDR